MKKTGKLFILSAPSGAGKTTLRKAILKELPFLSYSVSHTTRKPRDGEKEGEDYFFIDKEQFKKDIEKDKWAEWAEVHGNYYGTSADYLTKTLNMPCSIILDIDVKGTMQIIKKFPDAITIFIKPPSMEILRQRLEKRGTDDIATIEKRLANAAWEMDKKDLYKYTLVNDNLDRAIKELLALLTKFISSTI